MGEELYNVIFNGTILPGQSKEEVKKKLAAIFKVDQKKVESYFSSKPVLIKSKVSKQVSAQYTAAFKKAGAKCIISPVGATKTVTAKPTVAPKGIQTKKPAAKAAPTEKKETDKPTVAPKGIQTKKPAAKAAPTEKKEADKPTVTSKGIQTKKSAAKTVPTEKKEADKQVDKVVQPYGPAAKDDQAKSAAKPTAKPTGAGKVTQLQKSASKASPAQKAAAKPAAKAKPGEAAKTQKTSSQDAAGQKLKDKSPEQHPKSPDPKIPVSTEPDVFGDIEEKKDEQDTSSTIEMLKKKYKTAEQDMPDDTMQKKQESEEGQDLLNAWNDGLDDTSDELDQLFSNLTTTGKNKGKQKPAAGIGKMGTTVPFDDVQKLFEGYDGGAPKKQKAAKEMPDDFHDELEDLFSSLSSDTSKSKDKAKEGSEFDDFDESLSEHSDESTQFMLPPHMVPGKTEEPVEKEEESTQFMFPPNATETDQDNGMRRKEDTDRTIEAPPFFDSEDIFGSPDELEGGNRQAGSLSPDSQALSEEEMAFKASSGAKVSHTKTKKTALLLAIGTAPFAWLYTYKQDKKKFLINIGITVITAGLWGLGAWIWAIIDIAKRPEEFYESIKEDDKLGLIALIMGIFGLFIPAIICGYVHLSRVKKSGNALPGKHFAMIGLILGIVSAVLFIVLPVLFLNNIMIFLSS